MLQTWINRCLFLALAVAYAAPARALPAMADYWRLTCVSKKVKGPLDSACSAALGEKRRYDAAQAKYQEAGAKGNAPQENHAQSAAQVKAVAQALDAKSKQNKTDAKLNYWAGLALGMTGDEWAVNKLDDAMRNSKDPILTARAELAMAEFLFDKKGPGAALEGYRKVVKLKDPGSALYARYKLAWVDYASGVQAKNNGLKKQALTSLARISHDANSSGGGGGVKKKKKKRKKSGDDDDDDDDADKDAEKDGGGDPFIMALAKVVKDDILNLSIDYGNAPDVQNILRSVGASDVYATFLERAAYVKWEAGQTGDAYKMFAAAIKEQKDAKNLQLNLNLAQIAGQMNNIPLLLQNLKVIQKTFLADKAPWRKKQKPAELKKTDKQLETTFFDYCAALDQAARKDQQPKSLASADELYGIFLAGFPKSPKAYEARFYDGQILYIMKSYLKSAQALVAMVTQNPRGKFTKDGLDVMVTAAQTAVDNDKTKYDVAKMGSLKKPQTIPTIRKTYAEALELYVKMTPKTDKTPAMRYVAAGIYYDYGHYKEATKTYWSYVQTYPTDPMSLQAAQRLLEYYKQQKSEGGFEKAKAKLADIKPIGAAPQLASYFVKKDKGSKKGKKGKKGDDGTGDTNVASGSDDDGGAKAEPVSEKTDDDGE